MKSYAQQAEGVRLTFVAGISSITDVIRWADSTLASIDQYDDDLANLALAENAPPQQIDSMLRHLAEGADENDALRLLAGHIHLAVSADRSRARDFCRILEQLWIENNYEVADDLQFMAGIDDEFGLAERGEYGTVDAVIDGLINETRQFKNLANNRLDGTR